MTIELVKLIREKAFTNLLDIIGSNKILAFYRKNDLIQGDK